MQGDGHTYKLTNLQTYTQIFSQYSGISSHSFGCSYTIFTHLPFKNALHHHSEHVVPKQYIDTDGMYIIHSPAFNKDISMCFNSSFLSGDNLIFTSCKPTTIKKNAMWMLIDSTNALILYHTSSEYTKLTVIDFIIDDLRSAE